MDWQEHHEMRRQEGRVTTNPPDTFNIRTLGEAVRPESLRGEAFRLSREERDHIAGHALDSMHRLSATLCQFTRKDRNDSVEADASNQARKIAALSNLLGDIGWERAAMPLSDLPNEGSWVLGELFPVAQLRPWLEEWQRQDDEALLHSEQLLEVDQLARPIGWGAKSEGEIRQAIANAQTKLGTGAILLARIEKWMASRGN